MCGDRRGSHLYRKFITHCIFPPPPRVQSHKTGLWKCAESSALNHELHSTLQPPVYYIQADAGCWKEARILIWDIIWVFILYLWVWWKENEKDRGTVIPTYWHRLDIRLVFCKSTGWFGEIEVWKYCALVWLLYTEINTLYTHTHRWKCAVLQSRQADFMRAGESRKPVILPPCVERYLWTSLIPHSLAFSGRAVGEYLGYRSVSYLHQGRAQ